MDLRIGFFSSYLGTSRPNFCFFPMDGSVPQRDLYRVHALECLEEARAVKDRELSSVFHRLAMWWVILAHQSEDDDRGPHTSGRFWFDDLPLVKFSGAKPD